MVYNSSHWVVLTTPVFDAWLSGVKDARAKANLLARIRRAEQGNLGDCRPVGDGVSELRIHLGPGYRIYVLPRGRHTLILLSGGDKSTQAKDIELALSLAKQV